MDDNVTDSIKDDFDDDDTNNEVNIGIQISQKYSVVVIIYACLVGYVMLRHIADSTTGINILRLITCLYILLSLWIPHAVKVDKENVRIVVWLTYFVMLSALIILVLMFV